MDWINVWRLVDQSQLGKPIVHGVHNHWLCVVAVCIAIFAAGVLLPVTHRYHRRDQSYRRLWLWGGSLAMGTGIWAMHFTAMIAYRLPMAVTYDVAITIASIVPAVLASGYCILNYHPARSVNIGLQRSALAMALGIGLMHYVGMEAMNVAADMYYSPGLFGLSLAAAYLLALVGLYIHAIANTGAPRKVAVYLGSVVLGLAVSGMHFIAMKATYFVANDDVLLSTLAIEPYGLIAGIVLIAAFLIVLMMVGLIVDRRFARIASSLQQSEMRFAQLAENTQMAIFTFDAERVIYANPALCKFTGYDSAQLQRMTLEQVFGEAFNRLAREVLTPPLVLDQAVHEEYSITTRGGEARWMYFSATLAQFDDQLLGLASGFDISDQKQAEYTLRALAYNDQLTGLGNRTMFIDRLDHHLKLNRRSKNRQASCVMLLDLDEFKNVNDNFGHQFGDELLQSVAHRIATVSRESDTLARLGGDEFVMLFENLGDYMDWSLIAEKLVEQFAEPINLGGGVKWKSVPASASCPSMEPTITAPMRCCGMWTSRCIGQSGSRIHAG